MTDRPKTLDEAMADDHAGHRWTVFAHTSAVPVPDKPGWVMPGPAEWYGVGHLMNWGIRRGGEFPTEAEAREYADELNRLDVQGPIPPEFAERRQRLKTLAPRFRHWAYTSEEGPPGARWPVDPDRYLVLDGGVGFHASEWETLLPDLAAVEEYLRGDEANVYRIVDLDTGLDVPFTREIHVKVGAESP